MFKKLLMKFSFFRKREVRRVLDILEGVKDNFESGHFNGVFIMALHKILKSPVLRFDEYLVTHEVRHLTTYTNTSMKAVEGFKQKESKKSNLERSKLININPVKRYFQDWYSNQESIEEFISEMEMWLSLYLYRNDDPAGGTSNYIAPYQYLDFAGEEARLVLSLKEEDFMESLTSRLLMLDLVYILEFYLGAIEDEEAEGRTDQRWTR